LTGKSITHFETQRISRDPLDSVRVGQWYWVKVMPDEAPEGVSEDDYDPDTYNEKHAVEELYCVAHVGSNYILFTYDSHGSGEFRLHFDEFMARCRPEENWREHLKGRLVEIQEQMNEAMQQMLSEGRALALIEPEQEQEEEVPDDNLLPVVATTKPEKYKTDLIAFRDERMPVLQKEIEELAEEYALVSTQLALPNLVKLKQAKKALEVVEDRIFTVELYCGLQETVHQIKDGEPAPIDTPIHLRQQLLYMDEECLFDYADGGMDFKKLEQFDEWVVKPANLERILPEPKGIVAFRVRREKKAYCEAKSLAQAWIQMRWNKANMETYLLIRNGERVYRIATAINFSPRLIPFENEIGEPQFKKVHRRYNWKNREDDEWTEDITPDHVEYDDSVDEVEKKLKHYNRMIILIQGLLDRSRVFMPHSGIKLTRDDHMGKWLVCVRDEEKGLPANRVTWKEYRDQLNKSLRKGKMVFSKWRDTTIPYETKHYRGRDWDLGTRPPVTEVVQVAKDRSQVKVRWMKTGYAMGRYDKYGDWVAGHDYERGVMTWIPMEEIFNLTDYNIGDYKMFLCDRALKGKYLEWAPALLTAEDMARVKAGRKPKNPRPGWKRTLELVGGELMSVDSKINPSVSFDSEEDEDEDE